MVLNLRALGDVAALATTASLLVATAAAQQANPNPKLDPVENFCKRYQHQSAITRDTLYIDGGTQWFHDDPIVWGPTTQGINTYLITTDMSDTWDWKGNISQTSVYKTREPGRRSGKVPALNGGAIWPNANQTHLYFYGGTTNSSLRNFSLYAEPDSDSQTLWKYDIAQKFWDPVTSAKGPVDLTRAAYGGSVVAPELNKAYYLGGILDRGSTDRSGDLQSPRFLDGLLEFDLETEAVRNISTSGLSNRARAYSQLVYVPSYGKTNYSTPGGKQGILVAIGGEAKSSQIVDISGTRRGDPVPMSDIAIYDISTENWYVQQATPHANEFPATRADHCLVVKEAPDKSSQAIYMYGGRNYDRNLNRTAKYLDDIWILTIPSFQWIKIFEGESPRYGHTCHVAPRGRQMITVGGLGQTYTANDNETECDWESKSVALYDLTTLQWGSEFQAYSPAYQLPVEVAQKINGSQDGGGSITSPPGGWSNQDLSALFVLEPMPEKGKSNTGAIVGGVIGGVCGLGLLAAGIFFYYRRYIKKIDRPVPPPVDGWVKPELEGHINFETTEVTKPYHETGALYEIGDGVPRQELGHTEVPTELP